MHLHNHEVAHQVELVIDGVGIIIGADLGGDGRGDELERARLRRGRKELTPRLMAVVRRPSRAVPVGGGDQSVSQCYTIPTTGHGLTRSRPSPDERVVLSSPDEGSRHHRIGEP